MTTETVTEDKKAERARKERERRQQKQVEAFEQVAKAAASFVSDDYHARFIPEDVEAIKAIVGRQDPIRFAFDGEPGPADGRDGQEMLIAFAQGDLKGDDPAAVQIRKVTRQVRSDERAPMSGKYPSLWGRKVAALLLALNVEKG